MTPLPDELRKELLWLRTLIFGACGLYMLAYWIGDERVASLPPFMEMSKENAGEGALWEPPMWLHWGLFLLWYASLIGTACLWGPARGLVLILLVVYVVIELIGGVQVYLPGEGALLLAADVMVGAALGIAFLGRISHLFGRCPCWLRSERHDNRESGCAGAPSATAQDPKAELGQPGEGFL